MRRLLHDGVVLGPNGARWKRPGPARFLAWSPVFEAVLALGSLQAECFLVARDSVPAS